MNLAEKRAVAVVCFGDDDLDLGVVFSREDALWVEWPDGHSDIVFRDTRGWLWDEYGEDDYPFRFLSQWGSASVITQRGTRLPIVGRGRRLIQKVMGLLPPESEEAA